jgi:hypothetical protein
VRQRIGPGSRTELSAMSSGLTFILQVQCLLHRLCVTRLERLHRGVVELDDELWENVAGTSDAPSVPGSQCREEVV